MQLLDQFDVQAGFFFGLANGGVFESFSVLTEPSGECPHPWFSISHDEGQSLGLFPCPTFDDDVDGRQRGAVFFDGNATTRTENHLRFLVLQFPATPADSHWVGGVIFPLGDLS